MSDEVPVVVGARWSLVWVGRRWKMMKRVLYIGVWMLLGGVAAGLAVLASESSSSVTTISEPYELDGMAVRGTVMNIVFNVKVDRLCPASTTRYLWRWTTLPTTGEKIREIVPLVESNVPVIGVGENKFMLSIGVPQSLSPGKWFYQSRTVDLCGWLPSLLRPRTIRQSQPVPVDVSFGTGAAQPRTKFASSWP